MDVKNKNYYANVMSVLCGSFMFCFQNSYTYAKTPQVDTYDVNVESVVTTDSETIIENLGSTEDGMQQYGMILSASGTLHNRNLEVFVNRNGKSYKLSNERADFSDEYGDHTSFLINLTDTNPDKAYFEVRDDTGAILLKERMFDFKASLNNKKEIVLENRSIFSIKINNVHINDNGGRLNIGELSDDENVSINGTYKINLKPGDCHPEDYEDLEALYINVGYKIGEEGAEKNRYMTIKLASSCDSVGISKTVKYGAVGVIGTLIVGLVSSIYSYNMLPNKKSNDIEDASQADSKEIKDQEKRSGSGGGRKQRKKLDLEDRYNILDNIDKLNNAADDSDDSDDDDDNEPDGYGSVRLKRYARGGDGKFHCIDRSEIITISPINTQTTVPM